LPLPPPFHYSSFPSFRHGANTPENGIFVTNAQKPPLGAKQSQVRWVWVLYIQRSGHSDQELCTKRGVRNLSYNLHEDTSKLINSMPGEVIRRDPSTRGTMCPRPLFDNL
jgi:hypothetical protein